MLFPDEKTRAVAVIWNPLPKTIEKTHITLPLYYAGFSANGTAKVSVRQGEGVPQTMSIDANDAVVLEVDLAPLGITYFVVEDAA